jgi:hypothetical protein
MMIQKMNFKVIVRKMMSLVCGPLFCLALWLPGSVVAAADHACEYLDKDEVATVLGLTVGDAEPQPANPMGQSTCFFPVEPDLPLRFVQLQMVRSAWAVSAGSRWTAPALFANNISFLDELEPRPGLGEEAYWGGSGIKLGAGLHVIFRDTYFTISVAAGSDEENLRKAEELARMVLAKLD